MKYLITGGAGFIGSNFIKYMLDKHPNDYFVCLDLLTYASSLESLEEVMKHDNFKFIHGDICDVELVDDLFKKYMEFETEQFQKLTDANELENHISEMFKGDLALPLKMLKMVQKSH